MRAATEERLAKVLGLVTAKGTTAEEVAKRMKVKERMARSDLAALAKAGRVSRIGKYDGNPPVFRFHYYPAKRS